MSDKEQKVNRLNPEPRLKALLQKRKKAKKERSMTKEQEDALFTQIAEEIANNATFTAVVDPTGAALEPGQGLTVQAGSPLRFATLTVGVNRQVVIPFFTDQEELRKWEGLTDRPFHVATLSFDEIYPILLQKRTPLLIDPFGAELYLPFETVEQIMNEKKRINTEKQSVTTRVVQEETTVRIGDPKPKPEKMIEALRKAAASTPAIRRLWLKEMIQAGEKSILVAIDSDGKAEDYYQLLGDASYQFLPWGYALDFVSLEDGFGQEIAERYDPIYRKMK